MWRRVADAARTTIGKDAGEGEPSSSWKRRMLLCEHSPIRRLLVSWKWTGLPYWVSVHFCRHKFGIEHQVQSQRPDRVGTERPNRENEPQGTPVIHECEANAQAIINISRKRLCKMAMPETRMSWQVFLDSISFIHPELYAVCVPDCIYRGYCFEYNSCGYFRTPMYQQELEKYRKGINELQEDN